MHINHVVYFGENQGDLIYNRIWRKISSVARIFHCFYIPYMRHGDFMAEKNHPIALLDDRIEAVKKLLTSPSFLCAREHPLCSNTPHIKFSYMESRFHPRYMWRRMARGSKGKFIFMMITRVREPNCHFLGWHRGAWCTRKCVCNLERYKRLMIDGPTITLYRHGDFFLLPSFFSFPWGWTFSSQTTSIYYTTHKYSGCCEFPIWDHFLKQAPLWEWQSSMWVKCQKSVKKNKK